MPISNDYKVGFGKPPVHGRFKPGMSGNPSGRPKRGPSFRADLTDELQELTRIKDGDREIEVTKQRALAKTLVNSALARDPRALQLLISLCRDDGSPTQDVANSGLSEPDLIAISDVLKKLRDS
jgi:hypothetical protein